MICQNCKRPMPDNEAWCADCLKVPKVAAMKGAIDKGLVRDSGRRQDGLIVWVHADYAPPLD
jgi:hypothetical protein